MKRSIALLAICIFAATAYGITLQERLEESRKGAEELGMELKKELVSAMGKGGPVNAISVCSEKAEEIARNISGKRGFTVGRTSLKWRNPENAPDEWERKVLEAFEKEVEKGKKAGGLEYYEITQYEGGKAFRYMRSIEVKDVCLKCHGERISKELDEKLKKLYPDDRARGYKKGDLRGAFTIIQPE